MRKGNDRSNRGSTTRRPPRMGRNAESAIARQAGEYAKLMLDATPVGVVLWDEDFKVLAGNKAAGALYGARGGTGLERFLECSPEFQPDGKRSDEQARVRLDKAFSEGRCVFEWMHRTPDGTLIPSEVTLTRLKCGSGSLVAGYMRDLREYKRMMREIEHKSALLQAVNRIAAILLRSRTDALEENFQQSLYILAEAVDADRAYIWKNHRRDGKLFCSQIYEWSGGAESQQNCPFALESAYNDTMPGFEELCLQGRCLNGIVRHMSETAKAVLSPQGILSILLVPIFLENRFWGFIGFDDCRNERVFSENDEIILRSASEMIAGALSHANLEMEVDKIFYDPLTGVYNRRFFDKNIQQIMLRLSRSDSRLSLMMLDIDFFKQYNDIYGHIAGDACLKAIAEALQSNIMRKDDFIARYGGDEFVVVLPHTDEPGACDMARKMLEKVRACGIPHEKNTPMNRVTVSVGITTGRVKHNARGANDFIRRADEMLYASKQDGRNRYAFASL